MDYLILNKYKNQLKNKKVTLNPNNNDHFHHECT